MLVVGASAIAGHSLSPWLRFKGGKGVATSLGVFLAVAPVPILICITLGFVLIAWTGYVSVASITGAALLPILIILIPGGPERPWTVIGLATVLAVFIIWKHRTNIQRLRAGTENKLFGAHPPSST
jgi:glycerol-3-phosphate acyltransferase PlsY